MNSNELGKRIKEARIAKKMTQSEVVGSFITRNMLSQIESGNATPSIKTLSYLSKKLELPLDQLMAEDTTSPQELTAPSRDQFSLYADSKLEYQNGHYEKAIQGLEKLLSDQESYRPFVISDECYALLALSCYQMAVKTETGSSAEASSRSVILYAKKAASYSEQGMYANRELNTKCMLLLEELLHHHLN